MNLCDHLHAAGRVLLWHGCVLHVHAAGQQPRWHDQQAGLTELGRCQAVAACVEVVMYRFVVAARPVGLTVEQHCKRGWLPGLGYGAMHLTVAARCWLRLSVYPVG